MIYEDPVKKVVIMVLKQASRKVSLPFLKEEFFNFHHHSQAPFSLMMRHYCGQRGTIISRPENSEHSYIEIDTFFHQLER